MARVHETCSFFWPKIPANKIPAGQMDNIGGITDKTIRATYGTLALAVQRKFAAEEPVKDDFCGHWEKGSSPHILCVHLKLSELDDVAKWNQGRIGPRTAENDREDA